MLMVELLASTVVDANNDFIAPNCFPASGIIPLIILTSIEEWTLILKIMSDH
jgi:hypothetical protein